jgi:hypothetical protein
MDTGIAAVVVAALSAVATIASAWIANGARTASKRAHHAADNAKSAADVAAANTKPVSNGFAGMVRDQLGAILEVATEARDQATSANDKIDRHLEAHANALPTAPVPVHPYLIREARS